MNNKPLDEYEEALRGDVHAGDWAITLILVLAMIFGGLYTVCWS